MCFERNKGPPRVLLIMFNSWIVFIFDFISAYNLFQRENVTCFILKIFDTSNSLINMSFDVVFSALYLHSFYVVSNWHYTPFVWFFRTVDESWCLLLVVPVNKVLISIATVLVDDITYVWLANNTFWQSSFVGTISCLVKTVKRFGRSWYFECIFSIPIIQETNINPQRDKLPYHIRFHCAILKRWPISNW